MQIREFSYFLLLFPLPELHTGSSGCSVRLLVNERGQPPGLQRQTLKSRSRGNCLRLTALKMRSQESLLTKSPFEMTNPVLLV